MKISKITKYYSVVCAWIFQTMKKTKNLLQQQISKKCAENENAKACLCIKIDQDFFENNTAQHTIFCQRYFSDFRMYLVR